jgi:hypothetical protein
VVTVVVSSIKYIFEVCLSVHLMFRAISPIIRSVDLYYIQHAVFCTVKNKILYGVSILSIWMCEVAALKVVCALVMYS